MVKRAILTALLVAACSGTSSKSGPLDAAVETAEGEQGGPCKDGDTCGDGLRCSSDLCVDAGVVSGDGDGDGDGGRDGGETVTECPTDGSIVVIGCPCTESPDVEYCCGEYGSGEGVNCWGGVWELFDDGPCWPQRCFDDDAGARPCKDDEIEAPDGIVVCYTLTVE